MNEFGDVETVTVEVVGGPYDGGILYVPKAPDETYGSLTGAIGIWGGIPIRQRASDYAMILDWRDLEAQALVFAESRTLLNKLQALNGPPPPRP